VPARVGVAPPTVTVSSEAVVPVDVDVVEVGELVDSVELAIRKVIVDGSGSKREGVVGVDAGVSPGTTTVGAVAPGAGVQFCSTLLQANPLSQQTSIAQVHVGPPLQSLMQIQTPAELLQGEPIGQQPGPTAQLVSPASQASWRRGRL